MLHNPFDDVPKLRPRDRQELGLLAPSVHELWWRIPVRYHDRSSVSDLSRVELYEETVLRLRVVKIKRIRTKVRQQLLFLVTFTDGRREITVTFFNPKVYKLLRKDTEALVWGRIAVTRTGVDISDPHFEVVDGDFVPLAPVYRGEAKIPARRIRLIMERFVRAAAKDLQDPVPMYLRTRHRQFDLASALSLLHVPAPDTTFEDIAVARRSLAYTEAWLLAAGMRARRTRIVQSVKCEALTIPDETSQRVIDALGLKPTPDQRRAIVDIAADFASGRIMRRLLQGDVGSGKTWVIAWAMLCLAVDGHQVALLAPTEILARQHMETIRRASNRLGVDCWFLPGGLSATRRNLVQNAFLSGAGTMLIGTHALLEPGIRFSDLRLTVIDEQHKFGVQQREEMIAKGPHAHLLLSTATPIPRTLTLAMHGDLDISIIRTKPPGRGPSATRLVAREQWPQVVELMENCVKRGEQVYVICSVVDGEPMGDAATVAEVAERLESTELARWGIGVLHGRLATAQKDHVMRLFAHGATRTLISSTVVEVGVDVPDATLMVVLDADRFGLTQLHQLRGRVGRGPRGGTCVLVTGTDGGANPTALKRMKTLCATDDGFVVAEVDLTLRGAGEWFAERQSGSPRLRVLDLVADRRLMDKAFADFDDALKQGTVQLDAVLDTVYEHFGRDMRFIDRDAG